MAFIWGHYHKKIWRYQSVKQDWRLQFQNHICIISFSSSSVTLSSKATQTSTRMPAFWGYSAASQSYKFKEFAKNLNFEFWKKKTLHAAHLLKLLDKMCKYEMDLASIVEDTEQTWFRPQTDRRMDRRTGWNQCTPFQLRWSGGIKNKEACRSKNVKENLPFFFHFHQVTLLHYH